MPARLKVCPPPKTGYIKGAFVPPRIFFPKFFSPLSFAEEKWSFFLENRHFGAILGFLGWVGYCLITLTMEIFSTFLGVKNRFLCPMSVG